MWLAECLPLVLRMRIMHDAFTACLVVSIGFISEAVADVSGREVVPFETVFPESAPETFRQLSTLAVTVARGEFAPATFAVRSDRALRQVTARLDLPTRRGAQLPAGSFAVRVVRVWEQSGDPTTGVPGIRMPELLLTDDLIDPVERWEDNVYVAPRFPQELRTELRSSEMKQLWLTVHAPEDTAPGTYGGAIELLSAGKSFFRVPLEVTVLPYVLPPPGKVYSIYFRARVKATGPKDYFEVPEERYMAELRSLREHGLNSLIVYENSPTSIDEAWRRIRSAGFPGPFVFIAREPDALAAVVKLTREAEQDAFIYGIDEVGAKTEAKHLALSEQIRGAGAKVMTALRSDRCRRLDAKSPLDWANLSHVYIPTTVVTREYEGGPEARIRSHTTRHEIETHYWPSWGQQPLFNRTNAGFYLWRSGLGGAAPFCSAAFQKCLPYHEDMRGVPPAGPTRRLRVYNTYYPAQGEPIPTLQYEALREGIDDLRYLRLAHDLMARLDHTEAAKRSVAEVAFKRVLDPFFYRSVPTAGHFEWARASLVALIAYLRGDTEELRLPELRPTLTRDKHFAVGRRVGGTCVEAWIQEGDARNRSAGNWFSVGALGEGARRRALIRVELPVVPPGTRISKATLSLYAYGVSRPETPHDTKMAVHRVLVPWDASACTWSERSKGVAWSQPGASGSGEDVAPQTEAEADTVGLYLPMTFDVTESVRAWYRHPDSNHGLLVKLVAEDASQYRNAHIFASSCTTKASHFRCWPDLVVETE